MTQRNESDRGINTYSTIRLIHSITRTMLWYGLEHFGHNETRRKEVDSFLYATIKRLLDLPFDIPHRAISAEFGMTPTKIQYKYITDRIRLRHMQHPHIMHRARRTGGLEQVFGTDTQDDNLVTRYLEVPTTIHEPHKRLPNDYPTHIHAELAKLIGSTGQIIFTDGSESFDRNASYGLVALNKTGEIVYKDNGKLSSGKSIIDAETFAMYRAMEWALTELQYELGKRIVIVSDSRTALDKTLEPKPNGPTSYLNDMRREIEEHENRAKTSFILGWVKGHSKVAGNKIANQLAKDKWADYKGPYPGRTSSYETSRISTLRQKAWKDWMMEKDHHYRNKIPTRRLKKHKGMTRRDMSVIFRLKTNKGWNHLNLTNDDTGDEPTNSKVCTCPQPLENIDGEHLLHCHSTTKNRPPNIEYLVHGINGKPTKQSDDRQVQHWIRSNKFFGFRNNLYPVNFIKLKIGQFRRDEDLTCPHCTKIFTKKSNLVTHIQNIHVNPTRTRKKHGKGGDCRFCGKTLPGFQLANHELTHTKRPDWNGQPGRGNRSGKTHTTKDKTCTKCGKVARSMSSLKIHMRAHNICHGCSREFEDRVKLKEHQRSNCGGSRS